MLVCELPAESSTQYKEAQNEVVKAKEKYDAKVAILEELMEKSTQKRRGRMPKK